MTNQGKKEFNPSISPLYRRESGSLVSLVVNDAILAELAKVQLGGKLSIRFLKEESKKSDKTPDAYLDYVTPERMNELRSQYANEKGSSTPPRSSTRSPRSKTTLPESDDI